MRRSERRPPTQPDEVVFVVVRKPQHLMRHHVPNVDDQVPTARSPASRSGPVGSQGLRHLPSSHAPLPLECYRRARSPYGSHVCKCALPGPIRTSTGSPPPCAADVGPASELPPHGPQAAHGRASPRCAPHHCVPASGLVAATAHAATRGQICSVPPPAIDPPPTQSPRRSHAALPPRTRAKNSSPAPSSGCRLESRGVRKSCPSQAELHP